MITSIWKTTFQVSLICLVLLAMVTLSDARLYIDTDTVTGIVVDVKDNVITLDSGTKYYPASDDMNLEAQIGSYITIRFFVDVDQKNRFTEVAAGKYRLLPTPAPEVKTKGFK